MRSRRRGRRASPWDRRGAHSWDLSYRRRDRLRPLVTPSGEARRPAPRPAAGTHDEDVVRVLEEVTPRGLVARRHLARQAGGSLQLGDAAARVLDQESLDVAPGPPTLAQDVRVLAGKHHERLVEALHVG